MNQIVTFDCSADASEAVRADVVCKTIGGALVKHYPGRVWHVDVTLKGGAAKIMCPSISMIYAYVLLLDRHAHDLEAATVRAGGQILEMFRLSRDKGATGGEERLQRDLRGEVIQAATGL